MWWHTRRNQISSFVRNGRVHLNRPMGVSSVDYWQPRCAPSAVEIMDTPRQCKGYWIPTPFASFPFDFPSRASPCAITFQLESTTTTSMTCTVRHKLYAGSSDWERQNCGRRIEEWAEYVFRRLLLRKLKIKSIVTIFYCCKCTVIGEEVDPEERGGKKLLLAGPKHIKLKLK